MSAAVERARVRRRLSRLITSALLEIAKRRGVEPRELSEDARTLEALALASWAARDNDMRAEKPKQWPAPPPVPREHRPQPQTLPTGVTPSTLPTAPPPAGWDPEDTPTVPLDDYTQIEMSEVDFAEADTAPQTPAAKHAAELRRGRRSR